MTTTTTTTTNTTMTPMVRRRRRSRICRMWAIFVAATASLTFISICHASKHAPPSLSSLRAGGAATWPNPRVGTGARPLRRQQQQQPTSFVHQAAATNQREATVTILDDDEEEANLDGERVASTELIDSFLTRESRNKFIARVYIILAAQLFVTAASCTWFGLNPAIVQSMMQTKRAARLVPSISLMISTIAWVWMSLSPQARRTAPMNWNLLTLFTIGEAITVGFVSSMYRFSTVVMAMLTTAVTTCIISAYTYYNRNSQRDLSQWGAALSSAGLAFLIYGAMGMSKSFGWLSMKWLPYKDLAFAWIGTILFTLYLAHHSKLVVGGKHAKFQLRQDEYIFGAMTLYSDIINIFLYVLQILGEDGD